MNYDPVEVVIDKVVSTFKLREWTYDIEEFVEHIAEGLKLIGAAKVFEDKIAKVTINGGYGRLPLDLQHLKHTVPTHIPYRESGSFIEVDVADGTEITIEYQSMPVDTRGYILVPDAVEVREAIMWYLAKILILQGEITVVGFGYAESEWQWRCGSARAALNTWSLQQAYRTYQDFTRLNPSKDAHMNNYENINKPNTLNRTKNLNEYRTR